MRLVGPCNNVTSGCRFPCEIKSKARSDDRNKMCTDDVHLFGRPTSAASTANAAEIAVENCRAATASYRGFESLDAIALRVPLRAGTRRHQFACQLGDDGARALLPLQRDGFARSQPAKSRFPIRISGCQACFGCRRAPQPGTAVRAEPSARCTESTAPPSRGGPICNKLSGCN
jgi:hypothetical protein